MACARRAPPRTRPITICATFRTGLCSPTLLSSCRRCGPSCGACSVRQQGHTPRWRPGRLRTPTSLSSSSMLIVRSPVRISFGGGGTDLPAYFETYGGAVLSTAINKYFYTILGKRSDGHIQIISSDLRVFETWKDISKMSVRESGSALEIPLAVLKEIGCEVAMDLFLASEIPPGTGLGSSASVCVNVLQAISTYLHMPLSKYDLADKAFHVATKVLNKPVGKHDEFAAAFGGLNFITFDQDGTTRVHPLKLHPEISASLQQKLMLFFTGAAHHSWSILKEQEISTKRRDEMAVESLHRIRELASKMRQTLEEG